ncbi:MAG: DNA-binding response regulator [Caldilineae bacterium]|nr:MAG: DNA-binding response regulator [Caldilineae bacterium]
MAKIRILLADDHTIVRKGIRSLLDREPAFEVVGEAENGRDAVTLTEQLQPDIVLMDHTMPLLNGLEALRQIKKRRPETKVIVLTMHTNEEYIFQFLQAGAEGYLVKQTAPTDLVEAIRAVHAGQSFLSPAVSRAVIDEYVRQTAPAKTDSLDALTDREREVLQLLAEGYAPGEIAAELHISVKTVGVHRMNIMQKLEINNMADLIKFALRKGIISLEP